MCIRDSDYTPASRKTIMGPLLDTLYNDTKRLVFLRPILKEIVHSGPFEERNFSDAEKITALINNTTFWADLHKLRLFLKPLKCFIKLMDHDCHCAHHEYPGELFILSLLLSCLASY